MSYRYINKELVVEVAREAEIPLSDIERFDECPESAATRLIKKLLLSPYPSNLAGETIGEEPFQYAFRDGFGSTLPHVALADEDDFVRMTQDVMIRLASKPK